MPTDYRTFIAREIGPLADGLVDCLEQTAPEVAVRINRRKLRAAGVPDDWLPKVCRAGEKVAWLSGGRHRRENSREIQNPGHPAL